MQTTTTPNRKPPTRPALRRLAFTLIELMVSIALVLILILGINQVFRITTNSIGAGQALSTVVRDNRAAAGMIYNDARTIVTDNAPFIIIDSSRINAYQNPEDLQSDRDGDVHTQDLNGN